MTLITTQDIADCKLDILTIDEVVESNSPTAVTKDGKTIKTLAGKLAELGYQVPVVYAGGIIFGAADFTKTVSQGGFIYAPFPEDLPFTTTVWGTDSAFFFVVQNGTGSVAGRSRVTFDNTASGLAATDVQDAIDEVEARVDTAETNISTLTTKQDNLITLSGVAANSTTLGTFTGSTIPDSQTVKQALQSVETAYEGTLIRNGGTAGGTANALTCTCVPPITALTDGLFVVLAAAAQNSSGTVTFTPDGMTTKNILKPDGTALAIRDLQANSPMVLRYTTNSGGSWRLANPANALRSGVSVGTASQTYTGGTATYTFAHGLGVEPVFVSLRMTVKSAQTDLNYTAGRTIILGDTASSGYNIETDATNVYIRVATTGLTTINATTYVNGVLSTASKWDMSIRAFA